MAMDIQEGDPVEQFRSSVLKESQIDRARLTEILSLSASPLHRCAFGCGCWLPLDDAETAHLMKYMG